MSKINDSVEIYNDITNKIKHSNANEKEVAFNFFMPIGKLSLNSTTYKTFVKNSNKRIIETPHGKLEIRNRLLTEYHQKIVTAIIHYGEIRALEDGSIASIFKELDILKALGMGNKNYPALREAIKTIADTQYYITIKGITRRISIFREHILSEGSQNKMEGVVFHPEYVKTHQSDFSVDYKEIFEQITSITYPTIPSIIRWLMFNNTTEQIKEYELKDILNSIGFPIDSPSSYREIKSNLKKSSLFLKEHFDIEYDFKKHTIKYSKLKSISFSKMDNKDALEEFYNREFNYEKKQYVIKEIKLIDIEKKAWLIRTNSEDIKLQCYEDDLLFLLRRTTGKKATPSLFD